MKIRYPINIISQTLQPILNRVSTLLDAARFLEIEEGAKIDDFYFIGPYHLVKDLYATQNDYEKKSLKILIDKNATTKSDNQNKKVLANGVYLPPDYKGNYPFLMLYKRVAVLDGKPVLISENYITPGELVVVPESSEYFAVLFYNDGQVCKIPAEIRWFSWYANEDQPEVHETKTISYKIDYENEYLTNGFADAEVIYLDEPLLETTRLKKQLLNTDYPVVQVAPILSAADAAALLIELKNCSAWVRRTGENNILYTQETFDIWEYSKKDNSPQIFKQLLAKLQSAELLEVMRQLSGLELSALREVYAFHMQSNEFITKHADSSLGGQLLVRFNWLVQNPIGRDHDLRFWKGEDKNAPITRYKALPNSATIFYLGDATPHDLTPLPENADKDRYNIVITFGKYA